MKEERCSRSEHCHDQNNPAGLKSDMQGQGTFHFHKSGEHGAKFRKWKASRGDEPENRPILLRPSGKYSRAINKRAEKARGF